MNAYTTEHHRNAAPHKHPARSAAQTMIEQCNCNRPHVTALGSQAYTVCLGSHLPCIGSINELLAIVNRRLIARRPVSASHPSHEKATSAVRTRHALKCWQKLRFPQFLW